MKKYSWGKIGLVPYEFEIYNKYTIIVYSYG